MFTGVFRSRPHVHSHSLASNAGETLARFLQSRRSLRHRFVRSAQIGPFTVDFLCREAGVILELIGAREFTSKTEARRAFLTQMGYRVLHVTRRDFNSPAKMLARIEAAL